MVSIKSNIFSKREKIYSWILIKLKNLNKITSNRYKLYKFEYNTQITRLKWYICFACFMLLIAVPMSMSYIFNRSYQSIPTYVFHEQHQTFTYHIQTHTILRLTKSDKYQYTSTIHSWYNTHAWNVFICCSDQQLFSYAYRKLSSFHFFFSIIVCEFDALVS